MDNFILNVARMPIVGTSVKNNDGSSRQDIIKNLKSGDSLILKWETMPNVPYLISVYTKENKKIGNLNAKLADDIIGKYRGFLISGKIAEISASPDHLVCVVDVFMTNSLPPEKDMVYTSLLPLDDSSKSSPIEKGNVDIRFVNGALLSIVGFFLSVIFYINGSTDIVMSSMLFSKGLFHTERILSIIIPLTLALLGGLAISNVDSHERSNANEILKAINKAGAIGACIVSSLTLILYLVLIIGLQ